MSLLINLGSGQKPYPKPWINCDIQPRWNPDVVADGANLHMFQDSTADVIVCEHTLEHYGCGEADKMLSECYRILKKGGQLIVTIPDLRALAKGLLTGKINDETYVIVLYGAFMGDEADRHKFGFTAQTLAKTLRHVADWSTIESFNGKQIQGSTISADWWILSQRAMK